MNVSKGRIKTPIGQLPGHDIYFLSEDVAGIDRSYPYTRRKPSRLSVHHICRMHDE